VLILHVLPDLGVGGAELMMKRLVEAHLGDPRHEHRVVSLRSVGPVGAMLQAQGVRVDALGIEGAAGAVPTLLRLVRTIRSARPDIVQTWMYHSDLLGGLAARLAGCRRIAWGVRVAEINVGVARSTSLVRRICARLSSLVPTKIVYVAESARRVHEQLGYDRGKGIVVPNGFLVPASPPDSDRFRRTLGIAPGAILIGAAGRFNPQKDFNTFVRAAARLIRSHPDVHVLMAGRGLNAQNAELSAWIAETGHSDRFHLLDERSDLPVILGSLDLFCLSSLYEGLPNVVGEAMAAGVPCVVTDVGDAALLVGDTGWVVPPADESALSAALEAVIRMPREQRNERGRRARERIIDCFSMEAALARFEHLYGELAGGAGPGPEPHSSLEGFATGATGRSAR
jgi:glycosyltransferase involved in cell wall biosynthesis